MSEEVKIPREHLPLFERLRLEFEEAMKKKEKPQKRRVQNKENDLPRVLYMKVSKEPNKERKEDKIYTNKLPNEAKKPFSVAEMEQFKAIFWHYFKIAVIFLAIVWFLGFTLLIAGGSCG